jgi:lipopolysaccharide export system ATP-binding protein
MELKANNLVKAYRGRTVVKDISIDVKQGEIVGLLGTNGAGKTTSFYMMVGLVKPNAGQVVMDGEDVTKLPMFARARKGMGYLAQEMSVFRKLTAEENIDLVLEEWKGPAGKKLTKTQRKDRVTMLLDELGLTKRRADNVLTLSGGERRRVEIARVLATEPKFVLLDEPFTGVDPLAINDLRTIIQDLKRRGIGVLITDHNVEAMLKIVDRAYIISEGEIKTAGTAEMLVNDPIAQKYYLGEDFKWSMQ